MIKEFLQEQKKQRYYQSMENINNDIFHNHQRKLWAIRAANDFDNADDLKNIIDQSQEALDYFIALHKENIARYEALQNKKYSDHKILDFK